MHWYIIWRSPGGKWDYSYYESKLHLTNKINEIKDQDPHAQIKVIKGRVCDIVAKTTYTVNEL